MDMDGNSGTRQCSCGLTGLALALSIKVRMHEDWRFGEISVQKIYYCTIQERVGRFLGRRHARNEQK